MLTRSVQKGCKLLSSEYRDLVVSLGEIQGQQFPKGTGPKSFEAWGPDGVEMIDYCWKVCIYPAQVVFQTFFWIHEKRAWVSTFSGPICNPMTVSVHAGVRCGFNFNYVRKEKYA